MAIHSLPWHDLPPTACQDGAVSIGNFDGVHRGHAALLAELQRRAQSVGGPAVVLTFEPHPLQILRPEQFMPVLTTLADRADYLHAAGADEVIILQIDRDLLQLDAEEFFNQIIRRNLEARAMVEGFNFGFGRNRGGTVETLGTFCRQHGIPLAVVPSLLVEGVPVSSSRVRNCLTRGAVREAADLLDRPYRLRGIVGTGQRRGRTIGFPTANLEKLETVVPGDGVYAVRASVAAKTFGGAANIGPNPTFGEHDRKVEVHLIDFQGELYGQPLAVDFLDRIRDTRPFSSVAELVEQLKLDIEAARRITRTELVNSKVMK
jgi:riboflavin kinase/FMN adenylyltransferase